MIRSALRHTEATLALVLSRGLLGVAKDGDRFAAHAWLESGAEVLTGAEGRERYAVSASFAD